LAQWFNHAVDVLAELDVAANLLSEWPEKAPAQARTKIVKEVHDMVARLRGLRDRVELYSAREDAEVSEEPGITPTPSEPFSTP
jgi:hypothetical protein